MNMNQSIQRHLESETEIETGFRTEIPSTETEITPGQTEKKPKISVSKPEISVSKAPPPIRLRSHNTLALLSQTELDHLYDWLLVMDVEEAQQKLLQECHLQASIPCLHRYYYRRKAEERRRDALEAAAQNPPDLHRNAADAFAHLLYETTHGPSDAKSFAQLASWFAKNDYNQIQREYLQVARDRLALQTRTFEFNAARQVLIHFHKVREILDDPNIENQEKIERTRGLIFTPALPTQNP